MSECHASNAVWKNMNQRGVAGVTVAVLSGLVVMMAAFAIDVGHALVTRNQLQNAADAAALSAGRQLGLTYLALNPGDQQDMSRSLTSLEQSRSSPPGKLLAMRMKPQMWRILPLREARWNWGRGI